MNPQLGTLEVNPQTGEPFLRLQQPRHHDIIITPLRWDDGPLFIPYLNDPLVYEWMAGPPVPYKESDAEFWINLMKPKSDKILEELEKARDQPELITVGGCPVHVIRKVNEDGSDIFIGSADITKGIIHGEVVKSPDGTYTLDMSKKEENDRLNENRPVGDPENIWVFGDYLAPAYHGQGIMSDAISTIISKWAIPRMNARIIRAITFAGNIGSRKVFEKNGFKHVITLKDHAEVRGKTKTLEVLEWTLPQ